MRNSDYIIADVGEGSEPEYQNYSQQSEQYQRIIQAAERACENYIDDISGLEKEIKKLKKKLRGKARKIETFESFLLTRLALRLCLFCKRIKRAVTRRLK